MVLNVTVIHYKLIGAIKDFFNPQPAGDIVLNCLP